ncbi:Ethanolamine kinase 1, partial [Saguinus oedipus]
MTWMKEILSNLGSPVVLCHNDLLCKNIIYNEKQENPSNGKIQEADLQLFKEIQMSRRKGKLFLGIKEYAIVAAMWRRTPCFLNALTGGLSHHLFTCTEPGDVQFIDYEYSGYNYLAYDIGNHFNEFAGVSDVDYSLYPDRELQSQWLRSYLEAYKEFKGFGTEVTEKEVEILFIQVNQFAL